MQKLILRFCPIFLCQKGVSYTVYTYFHFRGKIINGVEHSIQKYWQVYCQKLQRCMNCALSSVLIPFVSIHTNQPPYHTYLSLGVISELKYLQIFLLSFKMGVDFCSLMSLQTAL